MVTALDELCREVGLARPPTFLWNPLDAANGGTAFGRLGRYYVALSGGLVTQFYVDPAVFRSVVLHELAHLRNADVDKTYFAVAVWQSFVLVGLVPFALSFLDFDERLRTVLDLGWRICALAALVYLTRNAVLRAREIYADVRASIWDGPAGALDRVLATLPRDREGGWRTLVAAHPDPAGRRYALHDTASLFRTRPWEAFGVGVVTSIAIENVWSLLAALTADMLVAVLGPTVLFVPLAAGFLVLAGWRATFAGLAWNEAPRGLGWVGLSLGLGLIAGQIVAFDSFLLTSGSTPPAVLAFTVISGLPLLIVLPLFLRWIGSAAGTWLEVVGPRRSLRLAYGAAVGVAAGLSTIWLGAFYYIQRLGTILLEGAEPETWIAALSELMSRAILFALGHPLTMLTLIGLWAFPLAVVLWRQRVAALPDANWAWLDPSPQPSTLPRGAPLRARLALLVGLAGGGLFCGMYLALRVGMRLGLSEAARDADETKLWFYTASIVLAAIMQVPVAAIVAVWVPRLGAVHGLFAAFVAGCVMTAGTLGSILAFEESTPFPVAWAFFAYIISGGAILALPVVLVVAAAAAWLRDTRTLSVAPVQGSDVSRPTPAAHLPPG